MIGGSLSIRARLLATMAVLAASLLIVGVLGVRGMNGVVHDLDEMYNRRVTIMSELGDLKAQELRRQTLVALTVLADDPDVLARFKDARKEGKLEAERLLKAIGDLLIFEEGRQRHAQIVRAHDSLQNAIDEVDAALADNDEARAAKAIVHKVDPAFQLLNGELNEFSKFQFKVAGESLHVAQAEFRTNRLISITATAVSLALAAALALMLMRAIGSGLNAAVIVAKKIADGRLGHDIEMVALPIQQSNGTLLAALCVQTALNSDVESAPQVARLIEQRLKPLLASLHRELAAIRPRQSKEQTLTERTEELEWLFNVTQRAQAASGDRQVLEQLLAAACERLSSAFSALYIPDKRLFIEHAPDLMLESSLREVSTLTRQHLLA